MSPRTVPTLLIAVFAALSVGCGEDPPAAPPDDPSASDPPGYTDPLALIVAHEKALERQDYALYEKLLHPDFEYFPQSTDLTDFPWLAGRNSWGRPDELQMIRNMFDDNFTPAGGMAGTVASIDAKMTVIGQQTLPDGTRVVMTKAIITVMFPSGSGARSDVRLEFRLVGAADGFLRIRSIHEMPPYMRAVEPESWGAVKALYRDEVQT